MLQLPYLDHDWNRTDFQKDLQTQVRDSNLHSILVPTGDSILAPLMKGQWQLLLQVENFISLQWMKDTSV